MLQFSPPGDGRVFLFVQILMTDLRQSASDDDRIVVEVAVAGIITDIEKSRYAAQNILKPLLYGQDLRKNE